MSEIRITAERAMTAAPSAVYNAIADYRHHHANFLPANFSDFRVERGGFGAGTIVSFRMAAGGRTQAFRHQVAEPMPGSVLTESDERTVTTFTVTPARAGSHVRIDTVWHSSGLQGLFERLFAPRLLRKLYADELESLDRYAAQLPAAPPTVPG